MDVERRRRRKNRDRSRSRFLELCEIRGKIQKALSQLSCIFIEHIDKTSINK